MRWLQSPLNQQIADALPNSELVILDGLKHAILRRGSSIVFLSSLAAHAVVGTMPAYAATKGAIDTLVKHFASMLGARGIRVNAVAPGVVQTDMSNFTKTDAGRDFALGMQALKRLARPDDIGGSPSWRPKVPGGSPAIPST